MTILLLTLFTTGWIFFSGTDDTINTPQTSAEDTSYVDDITLDTFIRVYATEILNDSHYKMTSENREAIRRLLSSMGEINLQILKESIFQGTPQDISNAVKAFTENNFMWEEKTLMKQYLN